MSSRIKEGDCVSVNFHAIGMTLCECAVVIYKPCATGDSWILEDNDTGQIHYISEGCTISQIKEA